VQLLMTVKQCRPGIIGHEIECQLLEAGEHHHVLDYTARRFAADLLEFRAVPRPDAYPLLTVMSYFDIFGSMKSQDAVGSLAALAQESRLAIFRLLVRRGPEGYTPTQLGDKLGVALSTLSFHLKELQRAGLIDVRRDGRFLYYRPNFSHMNQLLAFLSQSCCVLADKDCGPECSPAQAEASTPKRKQA